MLSFRVHQKAHNSTETQNNFYCFLKTYSFTTFEISINILYHSDSGRIFSGTLVGFRRPPKELHTDGYVHRWSF